MEETSPYQKQMKSVFKIREQTKNPWSTPQQKISFSNSEIMKVMLTMKNVLKYTATIRTCKRSFSGRLELLVETNYRNEFASASVDITHSIMYALKKAANTNWLHAIQKFYFKLYYTKRIINSRNEFVKIWSLLPSKTCK